MRRLNSSAMLGSVDAAIENSLLGMRQGRIEKIAGIMVARISHEAWLIGTPNHVDMSGPHRDIVVARTGIAYELERIVRNRSNVIVEEDVANDEELQTARLMHQGTEIRIDDAAAVERQDGGDVWVAAWVRVPAASLNWQRSGENERSASAITGTIMACISSGKHLTSCDRDGFCNNCGEQ